VEVARRHMLQLAGGAVVLAAAPRPARADSYPVKPVRWIIGYTPGGTTDILSRLVAQGLSEQLGQPFIIETRPGAGTNIATETVVRAPPDGYTLLFVGAPNAINATLYAKLNFNFIRDIAPVAGIVRVPNAMVVHPSVPVTTVPEFIAYAKSNPGKINMASSGVGSSPHLAGELFKMMAGVDVQHVPYRGAAPALTDLLAGQVHLYFVTTPSSIGYIKAGRLRAIAVTTAAPVSELPGVPTISEFLPGFEASAWYGVGSPKDTPADIIGKLNRAINGALADDPCTAQRAGLHGHPWLARRLRSADRRRNREMGQGSQVLGREDRITGPAHVPSRFVPRMRRGRCDLRMTWNSRR
jgi:tripartite-type tricarboxylate transporter receptor subunit TctC